MAALGCVFAALCYAEFAAMAPVAGSAYTYAYATLGEIFAWIIGWDLILEYADGLRHRGLGLVGLSQQAARSGRDSGQCPSGSAAIRSPRSATRARIRCSICRPLIIVVLTTVVLVIGIRESAKTNAVLVIVKLAVVLFVIGVGWSYIDRANWTEIPVTERHLAARPGAARPGEEALEGTEADAEPVGDRAERPQPAVSKQLQAAYRKEWVRQETERLVGVGADFGRGGRGDWSPRRTARPRPNLPQHGRRQANSSRNCCPRSREKGEKKAAATGACWACSG